MQVSSQRSVPTFPRQAAWLVGVAMLVAACSFDPPVKSGSLKCAASAGPGSCPPGYFCSLSSVCCAGGDRGASCQPPPSVSRNGGAGGTNLAGAPGQGAAGQGGTASEPGDRPGGAGQMDSGASGEAVAMPGGAPVDAEAGVDAQSDSAALAPLRQPRRILPGKVDLIGEINSCTDDRSHGDLDRWCAITRGKELWVINVTKALSEAVTCDGTSPSCLRMTTNFTPLEPAATRVGLSRSRFWGDLLLFTSDSKPPIGDLPRATFWAWYPGWAAPRKLTSADGLSCRASTWTNTAWCLDRVPGMPSRYDFSAGVVGPTSPPLLKLAQATPPYFDAALTKDGKHLVYQQIRDGAAVGPLWLVPMATAADKTTHFLVHESVALSGFEFSADAGTALYFLYGPQADPTQVVGTLAVIDLKKPAQPIDLAPNVNAFYVVRGVDDTHLGLVALQNLIDRTGVLKLFLGVLQLKPLTIGVTSDDAVVSRDGRYTFFQPEADPATGRRDARVANHEAGSVCALQRLKQTKSNWFDSFSVNGKRALWEDFPDPTQVHGDGWLARSSDCGDQHKFATRVTYWRDLNSHVLIFADQYAAGESVVRYLEWGPDMAWPAKGPVTLQEHVRRNVDVISPSWGKNFKYAIYTSHFAGAEGLYVAELPH